MHRWVSLCSTHPTAGPGAHRAPGAMRGGRAIRHAPPGFRCAPSGLRSAPRSCNEPDRRDLGRPLDPAARGSGAGDRQRTLHRRSAGGAIRALRAQLGGRRTHRAHRRAGRRDGRHGRRSEGVKPIRPMLHKFNYVPVGQPILADGVVRYVGEAIAAVLAESAEAAEDIADRVEVEIEETTPRGRCACRARARRAAVHAEAPTNVIVEGRVKTPGFDAARAARPQDRRRRGALAPPERAADGAARRACRLRCRLRPRHAHLLNPDAASDAHRHCRSDRHAGNRICA